MRILALMVGVTAVTGASAGQLDTPDLDTDAITTQFVYEARFGGEAGMPAVRSFQWLVANEGQRLHGVAPFRAEFRADTGRFLVNGMDVERTFISRQEEGGLASAWGGWLPLAIVIGAAGLIVVDGQDQDLPTGTGAN